MIWQIIVLIRREAPSHFPLFRLNIYLAHDDDKEGESHMECRVGCGACCIAPSISSPIPGMPHGKPAGMRCIQLTEDNLCKLFGHPDRPAVCSSLRASVEMCGQSADDAMRYLIRLEDITAPDKP
jgi:uncharacterized protein